jgi:hypothetical protein
MHVTEFVQPNVIYRGSGSYEILSFEVLVGLSGSKVELVKNPLLDESGLGSS